MASQLSFSSGIRGGAAWLSSDFIGVAWMVHSRHTWAPLTGTLLAWQLPCVLSSQQGLRRPAVDLMRRSSLPVEADLLRAGQLAALATSGLVYNSRRLAGASDAGLEFASD